MGVRPSVVTLLIVAATSLTVTAFAIAMPGASAPQARDLPRVVAEQPLEPVVVTAARPTGSGTPVPATSSGASHAPSGASASPASPVHPRPAEASSGSGKTQRAPANPGSPDPAASSNGSGDSHATDGHSSSSGSGHDSSDHEVVAPRLHESSDSRRSGNSD
jgi:hypothetical protein